MGGSCDSHPEVGGSRMQNCGSCVLVGGLRGRGRLPQCLFCEAEIRKAQPRMNGMGGSRGVGAKRTNPLFFLFSRLGISNLGQADAEERKWRNQEGSRRGGILPVAPNFGIENFKRAAAARAKRMESRGAAGGVRKKKGVVAQKLNRPQGKWGRMK